MIHDNSQSNCSSLTTGKPGLLQGIISRYSTVTGCTRAHAWTMHALCAVRMSNSTQLKEEECSERVMRQDKQNSHRWSSTKFMPSGLMHHTGFGSAGTRHQAQPHNMPMTATAHRMGSTVKNRLHRPPASTSTSVA